MLYSSIILFFYFYSFKASARRIFLWLCASNLSSHNFLFVCMDQSSYFLSCSSIYCSQCQASFIFQTILKKDAFSSSFSLFGGSFLGEPLQGLSLLVFASTFLLEAFIFLRQVLLFDSNPYIIHLSCSSVILPSRLQLMTSANFSTCLRLTSKPQFFMNLRRSSAQAQLCLYPSIAISAPLLEQSAFPMSCLLISMIFISLFIIQTIICRNMSYWRMMVSCCEQVIYGFYTLSATSCRSSRLSLGRRKTANSSLLISPTFMLSIQLKAQVSSLRWVVPIILWKSLSRRYPFSSLSRNRKRAMQSKKSMEASASRQDSMDSERRTTSASISASRLLDLIDSMSCWQQAISLLRIKFISSPNCFIIVISVTIIQAHPISKLISRN